MEQDPYGNAKFIDMRHVPVLFDGRPSLSDVFTKAKQKLGYQMMTLRLTKCLTLVIHQMS